MLPAVCFFYDNHNYIRGSVAQKAKWVLNASASSSAWPVRTQPYDPSSTRMLRALSVPRSLVRIMLLEAIEVKLGWILGLGGPRVVVLVLYRGQVGKSVEICSG
jgi:hypothetical protein